jgi:recombination protein RecR
MRVPKSLENFVRTFSRLPGIGRRSAERAGFFLLSQPPGFARSLAAAVSDLREHTVTCQRCGCISDEASCPVCDDPTRDTSTICVVESPADVLSIESTKSYEGLYHVLGGVISPLNGVMPDDLRIRELAERARVPGVKEILFATSPTTEGDTTVLYIRELLAGLSLRVTHLARGIPVGTDLQFAGSGSLTQAIRNREEIR